MGTPPDDDADTGRARAGQPAAPVDPERLYREYVVAHELERTGLFTALRARFPRIATVLYPGCFLHVTPSFHFQHVVYVDRNPLAARFFAEGAGIRRLVSARQTYRQRPWIRFIAQDFARPLPLRAASFDLLLALHAGGISRACAGYLRPGGILVTNDHAGDAAEALADPRLEWLGVLEPARGSWRFEPAEDRLRPAPGAPRHHVFTRVGKHSRSRQTDM